MLHNDDPYENLNVSNRGDNDRSRGSSLGKIDVSREMKQKRDRDEVIRLAKIKFEEMEQTSRIGKYIDTRVDESVISSIAEKEAKWKEHLKDIKRQEELEINPIQGSALRVKSPTQDELAKIFNKDKRIKKLNNFGSSVYSHDY